MVKFKGMKVFLKVFFKSCLLFFSTRGEVKIEKPVPVKDGFSVIDNMLYYVSGKTKIKIKEHFAETKLTTLDLVESAIKYEKRTETIG